MMPTRCVERTSPCQKTSLGSTAVQGSCSDVIAPHKMPNKFGLSLFLSLDETATYLHLIPLLSALDTVRSFEQTVHIL